MKGKKAAPVNQAKTRVTHNSISTNNRISSSGPRMNSNGQITRCTNRELAFELDGSTDLVAKKFFVNPGLSSFPWLSDVAKRFTKYRFRDLYFEYIPSKAVTTTPGRIYLAAELNPNDPPPQLVGSIAAYRIMESGPVYNRLVLKVPPSKMFDGVQHKKIRCGPVGQDLSLYDGLALMIATKDCDDSSALGQIFVYYDVELFGPQSNNSAGGTPGLSHSPFSILQSRNVDALSVTNSLQAVPIFGNIQLNGIGLGTFADGPWEVILPCGDYLVTGRVPFTYDDNCTVQLQLEISNVAVLETYEFSSFASLSSGGCSDAFAFSKVVTLSNTRNLRLRIRDTTVFGSVTVPADSCSMIIQAL